MNSSKREGRFELWIWVWEGVIWSENGGIRGVKMIGETNRRES